MSSPYCEPNWVFWKAVDTDPLVSAGGRHFCWKIPRPARGATNCPLMASLNAARCDSTEYSPSAQRPGSSALAMLSLSYLMLRAGLATLAALLYLAARWKPPHSLLYLPYRNNH